jgi:hypothetical protein
MLKKRTKNTSLILMKLFTYMQIILNDLFNINKKKGNLYIINRSLRHVKKI